MMNFLLFLLIFVRVVLSENSNSIKLKIGSIGAKENGEILAQILATAKKSMQNQGILDDNFDIEILSAEGCGVSFEGVAAAAEFYHKNKIDAFFGPYCSQELSSVATMASFWNIPIFGYSGSSSEFGDSKIYKTLIRTGFQNHNQVAEAMAQYLVHHNFSVVSIVSNLGTESFTKVQILETALRKSGIQISRKIIFEDTSDLLNSGIFTEIRDNSRIIIPVFSTSSQYEAFKNASEIAGISSSEFIFIYPMLTNLFFGKSKISENFQKFRNGIQIFDGASYDDQILSAFLEIFQKRIYIDETQLFLYVALYDSFTIFAKSAKKYLQSGNSKLEGDKFRNFLRGKSYPSVAQNQILLNSAVERSGSFKAFYVDSKREQLRPVSIINTTVTSDCDDVICTQFVTNDVVTNFWNSESGKFPETNPVCGFRNENCDYTQTIIIITATVCLVIIVIAFFWIRRFCETLSLEKMPWRILRQNIQILDEEQAKSVVSLTSDTTKMSCKTNLVRNHAIIGVNTHSIYDIYEQRGNIRFSRQDLILLTKMNQAVHDNINPFLGVSFNEGQELMLLWKYCSRGTLQDVIYSDKFVMDEKFHGAFVKDITLGLEYLHNSQIGYHGSLSTWTTLIDKNWMVKLTDYAIMDSLKKWEKHGRINDKIDNESEKKWQKLGSLYISPDIRLANDKNKQKRMDQKWAEQSGERRKQADIYAFGMIIYEILFRSLPYDEKIDLSELANKAAEGEQIQKPQIQRNRKMNPDMIALLQDCWSEQPDMRPTIRRVRMATETALKSKGSLVDSMMRMMEEYANNLEKTIQERTKLAESANLRAERLLFQLLPKQVAIDLKNGKCVPPRSYPSATVMFSDICGFTKLCGTSSPIEVVNLLNALYSEFDAIINKYDGYKVETIGDAYMVVSGVPDENGRRHVANVAQITLDIVEMLATSFKVPHRAKTRLEVRLGIASGPVAAGVIGLNAPRYCIFGETVNLAAKMEASGEPGRIQMTEMAKGLLTEEYPEYVCEVRGIDKELDMVTYWLIEKDLDYFKK